jgi:hypothetical protein
MDLSKTNVLSKQFEALLAEKGDSSDDGDFNGLLNFKNFEEVQKKMQIREQEKIDLN